jgi:Zn-dependent M16 (insulinase) family peptidase
VVSQMCYSVTLCLKEKKIVKKLSKKLSKNCQKIVEKLQKMCKKLTKGSAMYHWTFLCHGKLFKRKNQQTLGVVGGNSTSKAYGISFADRPKAKIYI